MIAPRPGRLLFAVVVLLTGASVAYGVWARRGGVSYHGGGIQIEVLNGSGSPGVARRCAEGLRRMGVDVKFVGNADQFDYPNTILLVRRGRLEDLKRLGRRIGCRNVLEQVDEDLFVDGTLILGKDARDVLVIR